ncbi:hypothetical protein BGZ47_000282, partial [Haplosporangium gracile]
SRFEMDDSVENFSLYDVAKPSGSPELVPRAFNTPSLLWSPGAPTTYATSPSGNFFPEIDDSIEHFGLISLTLKSPLSYGSQSISIDLCNSCDLSFAEDDDKLSPFQPPVTADPPSPEISFISDSKRPTITNGNESAASDVDSPITCNE